MEDFDEALKSYSEGPGAPGLERRVLNRIRAGDDTRLRWWLWALPVVGALALAWLFRPSQEDVKPVAVHVDAPAVRIEPVIEPVSVRRRRRTRARPSPERALISFLDKHPREAAHLLVGDEPLTIEPLRIQELP